jgi:hypothetical protein
MGGFNVRRNSQGFMNRLTKTRAAAFAPGVMFPLKLLSTPFRGFKRPFPKSNLVSPLLSEGEGHTFESCRVRHRS